MSLSDAFYYLLISPPSGCVRNILSVRTRQKLDIFNKLPATAFATTDETLGQGTIRLMSIDSVMVQTRRQWMHWQPLPR